MLKVVQKPRPEPELWEKILLTRELEPFYEWLGVPEWSVMGISLPVGLVIVLFLLIKVIRKSIHRKSEIGYHDRGY